MDEKAKTLTEEYEAEEDHALADPGGGATARAPPPTGSISFVFAYVFAKKCMHQRLAPPPTGRRPPPQREILDPPLRWNKE